MRIIVVSILFSSGLILNGLVEAIPSDSRFELLSAQFFTRPYYLALDNDTAFCAFDAGLTTIDLSNPESPVLIDETLLPFTWPREIHLPKKNIGIILNYYDGLVIVDVSDRLNPQMVGEFLDFTYPISMAIQDTIGYLIYHDQPDGMAVMNLSDPLHPSILGTISLGPQLERIVVDGDRAFIAANHDGLFLIDVSDLSNPTLIDQYDPFVYERIVNCTVEDTLIYLAINSSPRIQILSISSKDSLTLIGELEEGLNSMDAMVFIQDYLYVETGYSLQIIDVSDPKQPLLEETIDVNLNTEQLLLNEGKLYIPNQNLGIELWNVEIPASPYPISSYTARSFGAVDVADSYAYLTRWQDGLYVYSIDEPRNPSLEGYFQLEGWLSDILVRDGIAYLANGIEGLIILDVSNPNQPQWISQYMDSTSWANGLAIRDSLIFTAEYRSGIKIIDVSNPYQPELVTSFVPSMIDDAMNIALGKNFAYIANWSGIIAVDISDLQNPIEVAIYNNDENRKLDVAYHNNTIYYSDYHMGEFYIRDVTDPYDSNLLYGDWLGETIIGEDYFMNFPVLFSADYIVSAIDISDSQNPTLLDQFQSSHSSWDLAGNDSLIYSVGNSFVILDFDRTGLSSEDDQPSTLQLPRSFNLSQNYPNPFNPSTTIQYDIPEGNGTLPVKIIIYDVRGRLIRKLVDQEEEPGRYKVHWDGRDEHGQQVSSGVYLYRIEAGEFISMRKMVLLR